MSGILINFSGHALSRDAQNILSSQYDEIIDTPYFEFDFSGDTQSQLSDLIDTIPITLDGSRPIAIIPPGQSTLAILLVSFIHGMIGHFPRLCYLEVSESGVYLPRFEYQIAVQAVRSAGRKYRSKMLRDTSN
ncbi:TPA: hypothetical protein QDA74_003712 [Burkholderia territorii]|uniref:CRISPR-associated protein Csx15 n=1 Tax=Burkholderia territorii TaxID=1503055 RepID=UPI0011CB21DE|nr:CRISPR-associated protein Csx15 [Burkholderia territorii]TXG07067.1 hypothetical protein FU139_25485 [Burkholderia territorii]HDR8859214.1 hypothetical protein [Burkholderia territorii]HDR8866199.1 hypothetical protein [Burkholderia territorii]HDR8872303.1 hypothetical protein [Burkholderia territorii]HDR8878201.1 hypothetical protein [Burkholderia territorii]